MASSQVIVNEVAYQIRSMLGVVPSLRAPADQRSDFQLFKAEVYDLWATANPAVAAQALQQANAARREAHAIVLDY